MPSLNVWFHAGYEIDKHGPENPYRKNVYFIDPAGFEVEFVEYFSDIPSERNNDQLEQSAFSCQHQLSVYAQSGVVCRSGISLWFKWFVYKTRTSKRDA